MRLPWRKKKEDPEPDWPGQKKKTKNEKLEKKKKQKREKTSFKLKIPGLRPFKRLLAFCLMVFHFVVSQLTWTGPAQNQSLALVFLLTSFLLADYLWKTRGKPEDAWD